MRSAVLAIGVLGAFVAVAFAAPREASSDEEMEPRRGTIVIKPTGKKRVVRQVVPAPAPAKVVATTRPAADVADDAPPARVVSIGFLLREPEERGWGPQIHYADYYCPAPSYGGCDDGFGSPLLGYGFLGSPSHFGWGYSEPVRHTAPVPWCRK